MTNAADDVIVFDDVRKTFGAMSVLNGVSFTVKRGETLVIIGQSGVGKSVTLRLLLGLMPPTSGKCFFQGRDITVMRESELDELRSHFAMLFQNGALFDSMTIAENIAFPARLRGVKDREVLANIVAEKLHQVGLGKTKFPDMPGKMPSMVSGGQRKRIALARALAQEPEIILYDEPTTGLDPIMSDAVADLIISTRATLQHKTLTSIVITHDMKVATKTADRVIILNAGRVASEGTPAYFSEISSRASGEGLSASELMIRQFMRGEADGPILAVQ